MSADLSSFSVCRASLTLNFVPFAVVYSGIRGCELIPVAKGRKPSFDISYDKREVKEDLLRTCDEALESKATLKKHQALRK
eukprot:1150117-Pelagomonas_calceolata.AAC.1